MDEATKRAIERMKEAAGKAEREAAARQPDDGRAQYSDGTAHGLLSGIRMLEEEHAAEMRRTEAFANGR